MGVRETSYCSFICYSVLELNTKCLEVKLSKADSSRARFVTCDFKRVSAVIWVMPIISKEVVSLAQIIWYRMFHHLPNKTDHHQKVVAFLLLFFSFVQPAQKYNLLLSNVFQEQFLPKVIAFLIGLFVLLLWLLLQYKFFCCCCSSTAIINVNWNCS